MVYGSMREGALQERLNDWRDAELDAMIPVFDVVETTTSGPGSDNTVVQVFHSLMALLFTGASGYEQWLFPSSKFQNRQPWKNFRLVDTLQLSS